MPTRQTGKMVIWVAVFGFFLGFTNQSLADLSSGLVAYYPFNGDPTDESGNENHGTVNGATLTEDRCGNPDSACDFDGMNDSVEVLDDNTLDPVSTQEMTISAWIYIPTLESEMFGIVGKMASEGSRDPGNYFFAIYNDAFPGHVGRLRFGVCYNTSNYQRVYSESQVPLNTWVYVAVTHDVNDVTKLFINGKLDSVHDGIITQDFTNNPKPLRIGYTGSYTDYFKGCIDEVRIYERALSEIEIQMMGPSTYHVDGKDGDDSNNGLSKETAFKTIQTGIAATCGGDTVLVWPGVYVEAVDFLGKAITVQSADDAAMITQPGNTAIKFIHDEGPGSILANFVLLDSDTGIYCDAASPTIQHVTVVNNQTGIQAENGANPDISNSILWDNANADLINTTANYSRIKSCIGKDIEGLIGYWRLDEGSSTKAYDSSCNNYHGDIYGAEWGPHGLIFIGPEQDYVEFPGTSNLHLKSGFTLSVWVCFNTDNYDSQIMGKHNSGSSNGYFLGIREDKFCFYVNETVPRLLTPNTYRDGQWHHVVGTYDGTHACLYVDGVLEVEGDRDYTTINDKNIRLGNPSNGPYWLSATLTEISIFNKVLSIDDIQSIYYDGHDGYGFGYPLFADPVNSDYHLKSERGRYMPDVNDPNALGLWVLDEVTSSCIDAGDPDLDASAEPSPNGNRVNQGAYGATGYASLSKDPCEDSPLRGDINCDGEVNLLDFAIMADEWLMKAED